VERTRAGTAFTWIRRETLSTTELCNRFGISRKTGTR